MLASSPSKPHNAPHRAVSGTPMQARKQRLVRDAIWDAAIDLFAQEGFDETTVDDIARAAGVSRRSFFRYFSSKNDLMAQAVLYGGDDLVEAIGACPPEDSLSDVFKRTMPQMIQRSAANPRTRKIMQIVAKYPEARVAQLSRVAEVQDRIAEALTRRCRADSEEDELAASVLASLTMSLLGVTFRFWHRQGQRDISITTEQVFAALNRLVCENAS
jgi:AcrR family transcriptional regulator